MIQLLLLTTFLKGLTSDSPNHKIIEFTMILMLLVFMTYQKMPPNVEVRSNSKAQFKTCSTTSQNTNRSFRLSFLKYKQIVVLPVVRGRM